jgi:beta-glucanase (GH16 family)
VSGGNLKITAKSRTSYTSARLKSENKFRFTYGKVEVRAKLTTGAGTWPAIWMLGENYA